MKISKSLPTFVAEQFVSAIYEITQTLISYQPEANHTSSQVSQDVTVNATQVNEFAYSTWRRVEKGVGFLTVFKGDEKRMKVNDVNGLACVITTGLLKQLTSAYISVINGTDRNKRGMPSITSLPAAKKVLDILRYMDELSLDAIEFSMRSLRTSKDRGMVNDFTYLCDRYQEESWKQHLKTDYPNYDTSSGSDFPKAVAMAEMNTV